jgi:hypothetical protein
MSVSTPRDRAHIKYCPDDQCVLEYADPGGQCKVFDLILDRVEKDALHRTALEFEKRMDDRGWPRGIGPGVSYMCNEMNPYEKVEAFDPQNHEIHPGEFSDCPKCGEGIEHWHHKGTQEPVMWL